MKERNPHPNTERIIMSNTDKLNLPDCWVVVKEGRILGTHDEPAHIDGLQAVRYVPAISQPASQTVEPTINKSFTVAEQSTELDAGMAAQDYCRKLWGAARGHSDWRKVREHFASGYKQGRHDEMQASQPETCLPERDNSKPAKQQGVFHKFNVARTDGSDAPGGKHHGCRYFVLDVDHDAHAAAALSAYARACESTHPALAADLRSKWRGPAGRTVEPTAQPLPIPGDVRHAAKSMQNNDYFGSRSWAKKVIDFVADYAPPPEPLQDAKDAELNSEQQYALKEACRIKNCDVWFAARPQIDTLDRRRIFDSGFDRGFDAAIASQKGAQ